MDTWLMRNIISAGILWWLNAWSVWTISCSNPRDSGPQKPTNIICCHGAPILDCGANLESSQIIRARIDKVEVIDWLSLTKSSPKVSPDRQLTGDNEAMASVECVVEKVA